MKAMMLSAGLGRRMLPLTLTRPKPALPVLGCPLAVRILRWLARGGAQEAVVNLHHRPEDLRAILAGDAYPDLPHLHLSHEERILGTAGGIRRAADRLRGAGPIVVANSDSLADIDLRAVVAAHRESGRLATLVLAARRPGYSVVYRDDEHRVLSIGETPDVAPTSIAGRHLFTGCQVIEEAAIERIPPRDPSCIVRDVLRPLAAEGRVGSYLHDGFWWEFGSPELYLEGSLQLVARSEEELGAAADGHDGVRSLGTARVAVGEKATIGEAARFSGAAWVGRGSSIADGARIEDSVVLPGVRIAEGCRLEGSIIDAGVELPVGFHAANQLICPDPGGDLDLPAATRRHDGLLIRPLDAGGGA